MSDLINLLNEYIDTFEIFEILINETMTELIISNGNK